MSDGNRHHVIAYLGIGAALGIAIAAAILPIEYQPPSHTEQRTSPEPAKSAEQWAAEACAEAANASKPDDADSQPRDLCAQFRAAAAAERSAIFSEEQYRIGWIGLAGLAATVIVAVMAWRAASRSADADNKALQHASTQLAESRTANAEAQRISRNQSRAYVHVSSARVDFTAVKLANLILGEEEEPSYTPWLHLEIQNVGATPTKIVEYIVQIGREEWRFGLKPAAVTGDRKVASNLGPNDTTEFISRIDNLEAFIDKFVEREWPKTGSGLMGRIPKFFYFALRGRIVYRDVFDGEYFSDFGFYGSKPEAGKVNKLTAMDGVFARYEKFPPLVTPQLPAIIRRPPTIIDEAEE
jgi:hypothetical protein